MHWSYCSIALSHRYCVVLYCIYIFSYHIISYYASLYHIASYISFHHITWSVMVCITIEAYFMYLHSSHVITRCFRALSIAWGPARCHELSPLYSNGPQIGTLADALKTQLSIQPKLNVRCMGWLCKCVRLIKYRLSQNHMSKYIYQKQF